MATNKDDIILRGKALKDLRAIKDMLVAQGDPFLASVMNRAIGCIENQPAVEAEKHPTEETVPQGLRAVVKQLCREYQKAIMAPHVRNPVAYALYKVWKRNDARGGDDGTD